MTFRPYSCYNTDATPNVFARCQTSRARSVHRSECIMKIPGKLVLAVAVLACLACTAQAVFGDGSLNVQPYEKSRSLSKRSVVEFLTIFPWLRRQFTRSFPDVNLTTEVTMSSTNQIQSATDLKTDIARMLTLTRQKRAANEEHGKFPSRRSVQELRNIEGFLKAKHDTLTDALRNFNEVLFSPHRLHHHQQQQHPIQGGIPPQAGLSSILMPFSFQPARNTVLFLHHNSHRSGNNSNISGTNGPSVADVSTAKPQSAGQAEPAISTPAVVTVQQQNSNSKPVTTESGLHENQKTYGITPTSVSVEPRSVFSTVLTGEGVSTSTFVGTQTSQEESTTERSIMTEGSGTSISTVPENVKEDTVYRLLTDDA
ncbi:uncharacterized protein LOC111273694 isoform X2 [Varroa jacobsoni]|nr:uncharacterized protein LOC111273694 isoform X2 [Varroa jacobsoni]